MPQRVIGICTAVAGLCFVAFLVLLRFDLQRAAKTGPRWKRSLVTAGLIVLAGLGFVSCSNGNDVRHIDGIPATSAKKLEEASEWKRLQAVWQEAQEIASGKRGDYPFDRKGKERILSELGMLKGDISALQSSGLLTEAEAGLLEKDLAVLVTGVHGKRPTERKNVTCYDVVMCIPAKDSMKRLAERLPLLEKLAQSKRLNPEVTARVLENVLRDIDILENERNLNMLEKEQRESAINLREEAKRALQNLEFQEIENRLEWLHDHMCYMLMPAEPGEKDGSDLRRQLEMMNGFALRGKVTPEVSDKVRQVLASDLEELQEG
jgi:hypothetical protein